MCIYIYNIFCACTYAFYCIIWLPCFSRKSQVVGGFSISHRAPVPARLCVVEVVWRKPS